MRNIVRRSFSAIFVAGLSAAIIVMPNLLYAQQGKSNEKISVPGFVGRHLDSIGSEEKRKALRSITIGGTSQAIFRGRGEGRAEGIVVLASQSEKNMIGMKFNNPEYPYERMGFDGNSFTVGAVRPGDYTVLGQFLRNNERTFKSGLLAGVLSTAWPLHNYNEDIGRLKAAGKTKIDGVELLKYDYILKRGSSLDVTFFFDVNTFRHVRTEYRRVISGGQGLSVDTSSRQNETRFKMVEVFSGFKDESELTLPHDYVLNLEIISGNGTMSYRWDMQLTQFIFNQDLTASEFKVEGS